MRIGVNLLYLRPKQVGGSEVYSRQLIRHLAEIPEVEVDVFCFRDVADTFQEQKGIHLINVSDQPFSQLNRLVAENWSLRRVLKAHPVDVLFSVANFGCPLLPVDVPQVVTVHDLQHLWFRDNFSWTQRLFRNGMFRATFRRVDHVIAISDFTRQDLVARYGLPGTKVTTVLEGVDRTALPSPEALQATRSKYNLAEPFFYYPAASGRHKNHLGLLEAFAQARQSLGQEVRLVFTGARTDAYPVIEERIRQLGLQSSVIHLGFVTYAEVFDLMTMASALVFPSEFEGFGLPLLEAMQCGTPVIASQRGSIPEVVGQAAVLLDPHDVTGWAESMSEILSNDLLRAQLIALGHENVQRFSWSRCAAQTHGILRRCAEGGTL